MLQLYAITQTGSMTIPNLTNSPHVRLQNIFDTRSAVVLLEHRNFLCQSGSELAFLATLTENSATASKMTLCTFEPMPLCQPQLFQHTETQTNPLGLMPVWNCEPISGEVVSRQQIVFSTTNSQYPLHCIQHKRAAYVLIWCGDDVHQPYYNDKIDNNKCFHTYFFLSSFFLNFYYSLQPAVAVIWYYAVCAVHNWYMHFRNPV